MTAMTDSLFIAAKECLDERSPECKVEHTHRLYRAWHAGELTLADAGIVEPIGEPGRPAHPQLVKPRDLRQRKPTTPEGRAILFHALTHIEFNAINLALDAVYRFRGMPRAYYSDWLQVAEEEATHFVLLRDHLRSLGNDYGDFPGHNGLWEMAQKTAHDGMVRMALVPRCLEARGLDVNPGIKAKLLESGDAAGGALLDIILHDEIGHVAIGNRWFLHHCRERGLDPEATYRQLVDEYLRMRLRPPFHLEARRTAGFTEAELAYLEGVG